MMVKYVSAFDIIPGNTTQLLFGILILCLTSYTNQIYMYAIELLVGVACGADESIIRYICLRGIFWDNYLAQFYIM